MTIGKAVLYLLLGISIAFIIIGIHSIGASSGRGKPTGSAPLDGKNIEFLFIAEDDTFLAKIDNLVTYRQFKFSGEQPRLGHYRIVGIGGLKKEVLPITTPVESSK
jgi:hypothetical protein